MAPRVTPWHADALRLDRQGFSLNEISEKLDRDYCTVKMALLRARGPTRNPRPHLNDNEAEPRHRGPNPVSAAQRAEARRLHAMRVPFTHIAASLHMPYREIADAIAAAS